jgi:hypothetical protein
VIRNVQNLAINARDAMTGGGELNITEFLAARIPSWRELRAPDRKIRGLFLREWRADKKEVSAATRTPPAS